jgi:hypothetical protein
MDTKSKFLRFAVVIAVWVAATIAVTSAGAAAESGNGQALLVSVTSDGKVTVKPSAPGVAKPADARTLTLSGKMKNGVATTITCYVYNYGPDTPDGRAVIFAIAIECEGGVPMMLKAGLDLYQYNFGEWEPAPVVPQPPCRDVDTASLGPCYQEAPCFQAGTYYYGNAYLEAYDENGEYHEANFVYGPNWVGCVI